MVPVVDVFVNNEVIFNFRDNVIVFLNVNVVVVGVDVVEHFQLSLLSMLMVRMVLQYKKALCVTDLLKHKHNRRKWDSEETETVNFMYSRP